MSDPRAPSMPPRRSSGSLPRGLPEYRPVRSPLVSMGPSLEDERRRRRSRRHALLVVLAVTCFVAALVWTIVALSREVPVADGVNSQAAHIVAPVGRPVPTTLARAKLDGSDEHVLRLQLPVAREAVTAIGYDRRGAPDVVELAPEGARANRAWGRRMLDRFLATEPMNDLRWYRLHRRATTPNMVVVGAAVGIDAYAPIDGTVLAISDYVVDGETHGAVIQLQPVGDAETVVVVRGIDPAPTLAVGQGVALGSTLIGYVHDIDGAVQRPLASYTLDEGSALELYVRRRTSTRVPVG